MRRSLKVLLGTLFAALLSIVLWGLIGLSGPESHLQAAAEHDRAQEYSEVVRILDLAARSVRLQKDPEMLRELLEMRRRAHREQGNHRAALADTERLIELSGGEDQQHLDRIELLILDDRAEQALDHAQRLIARKEIPRAVELAGLACREIYEGQVAELSAVVQRDLAPDVSGQAWRALQTYLFRPPGDPEAHAALRRFHEIVDRRLLGTGRADTADHRLSEVRQRIQQAIGFFRRSLELGGQPTDAFRGLVSTLDRGGRQDDLIAQCEIQLRRFGHIGTADAASALADTHLAAGRLQAVLECVDRYLPPESWQQRLERGELTAEIRRVLLPEAKAYYALRDREGLHRTATETSHIQATGLVELKPEMHEILALHREMLGALKDGEQHLEQLCRWILREPQPGPDALLPVMRRRIGMATAAGLPAGEIDAIFAQWLTARPGEPEPYLEYARYALETGDTERAYAHAGRAFRIAGHDEDALRVNARAADQYFAPTGGDAASLLADCLRVGTDTPPNLRDEVLLLPLAELALQSDRPQIALRCADRAAQQFLWARWPRRLAARAALALGAPDLAVQHLESLLEHHPGDRQALSELAAARALAGRPTEDLLVDLLRNTEPTLQTLVPLLRQAVERGDKAAAAGIARRAAGRADGHEELLELLVDAWELIGETARMRKTLAKLLQLAPAGSPRHARATARDFLVRAPETSPEVLQSEVLELAGTLGAHGELIAGIARELVAMGRDRAAYPLWRALIEQERFSGVRDGEVLTAAGRTALRLGRDQRAAEHFLAAASFEDGGDAVLPLALTLLKLGRETEARPWMAELPVVDSITAVLALRGGRADVAGPWLADTLAEQPLNPELNCLVALGAAPVQGWQGLRELVASSRVQLIEVLTYLGAESFEAHAVRLAAELRDEHPANLPANLLHLRALGEAGRLQEAVQGLEHLRATHGDSIHLFHAAAALFLQGAVLPAPLVEALKRQVVDALADASPTMVAAAIRSVSRSLLATGGMDAVLHQLSELWRRYPVASGAGLEEARTLLQHRRPLAAMQLLNVLQPGVASGDRRRFWESWFSAAEVVALQEQNAEVAEVARAQALRVVTEEKPYGSATRFLLMDLLPRIRVSEDPELMDQARRLVNSHIALFMGGGDPNVTLLVHSLQWLERLDGSSAALKQTEELLRHDASLVEIWRLRAGFLERAGRARQAVTELRNVVAYILDESLVWTLARIAGQTGCTLPGDEELLLEAFGDAAAAPEVQLVRGLLALRAARYAEAESRLAEAAARPDGAHLYYRALANLPLSGKAAADRAAELFERLVADYPESPLTLYVGSFVRQLRL